MLVEIMSYIIAFLCICCLLLSVGMINLVLKNMSVYNLILMLDIFNADVVVIMAKVDVTIALAAILGNAQCLMVGLVVGARDNFLIEVFLLVCLSISESVLAQHNTLTEDFVVPGASVAIVRLLLKVLKTRSVIGLIGVTV